MRFRRPAAIAALAVTAAITLSGCVRMQLDVTVSPEAQVDKVGMVIGLDKAAMQQMAGMGSGEVPSNIDEFKSLMVEQNAADSSEIDEYCEFTESDTEFIMGCEADSSNPDFMKEIGSGGLDGFTLSKEGSTITATLQTESAGAAMGSDSSDPISGMAAGMFQTTLAMHFPGAVESVTGIGATIDPNDPNTVLVDMMKTDGTDVVVKAADGSGSGMLIPLLIGGGILLIAVIAVAGYLVASRKPEPAAPPASPLITPDDLNTPPGV